MGAFPFYPKVHAWMCQISISTSSWKISPNTNGSLCFEPPVDGESPALYSYAKGAGSHIYPIVSVYHMFFRCTVDPACEMYMERSWYELTFDAPTVEFAGSTFQTTNRKGVFFEPSRFPPDPLVKIVPATSRASLVICWMSWRHDFSDAYIACSRSFID